MRTARAVPTLCECRNSMISRTTRCSAQPATMRLARQGPIPSTSRRRSGVWSMTSNTLSPKAFQLLGVDRPDRADHPGGEVSLAALQRSRSGGLEQGGPKLQPMRAVVDPRSAGLDCFAGETEHMGQLAAR